jgi:hypothetical protein
MARGFGYRLPHSGDSNGERRDLPGSWATHPVPLPCSQTPAELPVPRMTELEVLSSLIARRRPQHTHDVVAQSHGFGTRCLRFTRDVADLMQDSLSAGC